MKNQLHVGTKADLSFNLRHFWPMKSFREIVIEKNGLSFQDFWRYTFNVKLPQMTVLLVTKSELISRSSYLQALSGFSCLSTFLFKFKLGSRYMQYFLQLWAKVFALYNTIKIGTFWNFSLIINLKISQVKNSIKFRS